MNRDQKAELIHAKMDAICTFADQQLAGTNGRFALVFWVDGHCDGEDAVAVAAQPQAVREVTAALTHAATWARKNHGPA